MKRLSCVVLAACLNGAACNVALAADAVLRLDAKLASRMETAPATYRLQATPIGLAQAERKVLYTVTLDGQALITNGSSMLNRITIPTPGTHTLEVKVVTPGGQELSAARTLNVGPNKAPVCNITVREPGDLKSSRPNRSAGVLLNPDCRDPDGRIVSTAWYLDGSTKPMRQSTTLVMPAWNGAEQNCFTVRFVAKDDYGNTADGDYTYGCKGK